MLNIKSSKEPNTSLTIAELVENGADKVRITINEVDDVYSYIDINSKQIWEIIVYLTGLNTEKFFKDAV